MIKLKHKEETGKTKKVQNSIYCIICDTNYCFIYEIIEKEGNEENIANEVEEFMKFYNL